MAPLAPLSCEPPRQCHRRDCVLCTWIEGNKTTEALGGPANAGEPTWLARTHPANLWSQPGTAAPADFVPDPSATQWVGGLGIHQFSGLADDVQFWRANPAVNFGWILISQDEVTQATARRFGAREDTNSPPELRIEFNLPLPPAPRLTGIQRIDDRIHFQFEAQAGVAYTVEHRASVASGQWFSLTNVARDTIPRNVFVSDVPGASNRFYRVVAR